MPAPAVADAPPATRTARWGRAGPPCSRPWGLLALSVAVAIVLVAPLCFLLIEAHGAGTSTIVNLIFRSLTASLLWNTIRLTVVVTLLCAVIGTSAAWFIERTDLPGRRVWAVLVVVPLAIPDFVVSFGWASLSTWVEGFRGAVLVMTLAIYPLVYLPVAASFRNADPGQEEVARSLGVGRLQTFWRITIGQARAAILGGCLLVALVLLAEYGAFEILGYQTFTTEIFTEFNVSFNVPTASALSLVLVLLSLLVLCGEGLARGRGRVSRSGPLAQRVTARHRLGRARVPVLAGFLLLVALALGVPVGASVYWMLEAGRGYLTGVSLLDAAWHTALYSGAAAATGDADGAAGRAARGPSPGPGLPAAGAQHLPGARDARAGDRTRALLLHRALCRRVPLPERTASDPRLRDPVLPARARRRARIGHAGAARPRRGRPLARPAASGGAVARDAAADRPRARGRVLPGVPLAVTELTATLILIPTGVQTLATQFWAYQQNLAYGQAAPFALAIIAIAAVPSYVLGRFFDKLPSRTSLAT